ncbi:MAG: hypothetical protein U1E36_04320 [Rickettsiales bacterium]
MSKHVILPVSGGDVQTFLAQAKTNHARTNVSNIMHDGVFEVKSHQIETPAVMAFRDQEITAPSPVLSGAKKGGFSLV